MLRKLRAPRDPGLVEIDEWERWFLQAQLDVIATQEMSAELRETEIASARSRTAAIAERMRDEYQIRQQH